MSWFVLLLVTYTLVVACEPDATVLEIAGGRSAELGIQEDDRVSW